MHDDYGKVKPHNFLPKINEPIGEDIQAHGEVRRVNYCSHNTSQLSGGMNGQAGV